MRIDGWQIEGFGVFHDCEVRGLSPGLTIFLGPNEAGKSTLLAFLRGVLFGFPGRRSRAPSFPPLRGGRHGGRVMLCGSRGEITIERIVARRNGLLLNGAEAGAQEAQALLGGADENLFCSVFAFSLSEMQSFEWLRAEQVRERIFSAGIAGAGASARQVIEKLEAEAASLYRKRGASRTRELLDQIEDAGRRLKLAEADAGRYPALEQEQEKWSARAAELAAREQDLRGKLRSLDGLIEVGRELDRERAELAALGSAGEPSEEPEIRLAELTRRVDAARARARLAATLDDKADAVSNRIEELYGRLALHRDRVNGLKSLPRDSRLGLAIAVGAAVAFGGGWILARGYVAGGVTLLLTVLFASAALVYQRAARNAVRARLAADIAAWEQVARQELGSERSGERLILELLGMREWRRGDRETRMKLAALDEAAGGAIELAEAEAALEAFRSELSVFRQQSELRGRIAVLERELPPGRPQEWKDEARGLRAAIALIQEERDQAIGERRLAGAELARIAESSAIPSIRAELECLRAELAECAREWRIATLAGELVARTLQEFTQTRQPAVLEEASAAFARVTAGAYQRILQDESGQSLVLLERGGRTKRPEELSRGTAEQLYLCLRLALASEFARHAESLPLIMDDVLVNFDPERGRAVARELAGFSGRHQILIFTCHPETARLFEDAAPGANLIRMERYGDSAAAQEEVGQQGDSGRGE